MVTNQVAVRILSSGLDEEKGGEIVLRGRVASESFVHLVVDDYQRAAGH